ncbi:GH1 family beta-glucosidase [Jatrophihabitans sp. YIM 134969]
MTSTARSFPRGFRWGSATAAYQIEGAAAEDGRTPSIWDTFAHTPGNTKHGDHGDVACDHYHRLEPDLDLLTTLGLQVYRSSVSWSRVVPHPDGEVNAAGLDFYDRVVDGLLARGIDPMVTLYHWDMPQWLQDKGGWGNRDVADHFADFTEAVLTRLGDRVPTWITVNEPFCVTYIGHLEGRHAPGLQDEALAVSTVHHVLLAHGRAMQRIRALAPQAEAGITLNLSDVHAATDRSEDVAAANKVDLVENRMFLSPVLRGEYPDDAASFYQGVTDFSFVRPGDLELISSPGDLLGVNFYEQHHVVAADGLGDGKNDRVRGARKLTPEPPVTDGGVAIRPRALYNVLTRLHRDWTPLPLWVTENGLALHDYATPDGQIHDPERIAYFDGYFRAAADAIDDGVPLAGFIVWSLMDNFEWAEGYGWRFGMVYNDYPTQTRIPKDSARWLQRVIAANAVPPLA